MKRSPLSLIVNTLGCAVLLAIAAYIPFACIVRKTWRTMTRDERTEPIGVATDPELALPIEVCHVATGIRMRLVHSGEYLRGAPADDIEASPVERPQHRVRLTKSFYLGVFEVTQAQWTRVMGAKSVGDEATRDGDDFPLHGASMQRVSEFLERTGLRLPTDAEWEYACRAGDPRPCYGPIHDIAWCADRSWNVWEFNAPMHPVGLKLPNAWGFHDMLGNVREYCSDAWPGGDGYHVGAGEVLVDPCPSAYLLIDNGRFNALRGGCASAPATRCRASSVECLDTSGPRGTGFRVALDA